MATDIAFAVGVVALLGRRVPASLKLFLLTLAIVDDIGAIIVIGIFYSSGLQPQFLGAAAAAVVANVLLNRAGIVWLAPYLVLGVALWLMTYASRGARHHRRRRPRTAHSDPEPGAGLGRP